MLLRRVIKHVKDQNWFAVFVDFCIVVVGILIAFQITNWSDRQEEKVREQEVLVAVLDDLKSDLASIESSSAMIKINIDTSNYLLEQAGFKALDKLSLPVSNVDIAPDLEIKEADPILEEQKNQLWKLVTVHYYPVQSNAAFSSLIAAGDLKIISNRHLISDLQSYTKQWVSLQNSNVTTFKRFRDRAIFVGQELGLSPFSNISEKELITLIQNNPKLKAVLRTLLEYSVVREAQIEPTKKLAMLLIDTVEKEIK